MLMQTQPTEDALQGLQQLECQLPLVLEKLQDAAAATKAEQRQALDWQTLGGYDKTCVHNWRGY